MYLPTMEDVEIVIKPEAARLLTSINRLLAKEGIQSYLDV